MQTFNDGLEGWWRPAPAPLHDGHGDVVGVVDEGGHVCHHIALRRGGVRGPDPVHVQHVLRADEDVRVGPRPMTRGLAAKSGQFERVRGGGGPAGRLEKSQSEGSQTETEKKFSAKSMT